MKRTAEHAGYWYSDNEEKLSLDLDRWLDRVPDTVNFIGPASSSQPALEFPVGRARAIIAPHAGYSYSGPAAAWAYKALDLSKAKRIFVLGPSHHFYLTRCALSQCTSYETPFGDLHLDLATIAELRASGMFETMSKEVDEAEHSIEMHLPYIHKMLTRAFSDNVEELPPIIPILVGNTSTSDESRYGRLLAPYLADPKSIFIVSSDFCHWGTRFRYTYYEPLVGSPRQLRSSDKTPSQPLICESIGHVDARCMGAIESGECKTFWQVLSDTGNTVCGRHPIGIVMAALASMKEQGSQSVSIQGGQEPSSEGFKFVRYERSSECRSLRDSSVSYASGFAVL